MVAKSEFLENSNRNVSLIAMYLYDDTELKSYIKKNEDNKLVVALAYLDNYEEALESYVEKLTTNMAGMEDRSVTEEMEQKRQKKKNITVVTPEMLEKYRKIQLLANYVHYG